VMRERRRTLTYDRQKVNAMRARDRTFWSSRAAPE
jgi:hypothetical protein